MIFLSFQTLNQQSSVMTLLRYCFLTLNWLLFTHMFTECSAVARNTQADPEEPVKIALLIHISEFQPGAPVSKLPTEKSLSFMRSALENQGFRPENMVRLSGKEATSAEVRRTFERFIETKVKGRSGAVVTILLDSHGMEVPDKNHDEGLLNPLDEYDEAFVCYDYTGIDQVNAVRPKGYILDDELGIYYDRILQQIGPLGHLVVFTAGCHSATQTKGDPAGRVRLAPIMDYPAGAGPRTSRNRYGKFIYFASVKNDSTAINPYIGRKSSYLVHGVSEALNNLTPNSSYHDLLTKAKSAIERDMAASDIDKNVTQLNIPGNLNQDRFEKVFRGYIRQSSYFEVVVKGISETMKILPESIRRFWENKKSHPDLASGGIAYLKGGIKDGLAAEQVIELTDAAGKSVALGAIIAANDTGCVIQPDRPIMQGGIKVRRPTATLSLYADETVPAQVLDVIGNYMSIDENPDKAQIRLSRRNGDYQLCATSLPYTADGCASFTGEHVLLQKVRSLAVYQLLKYKQKRKGAIEATYVSTNALPAPVGKQLMAPCSIFVDKSSRLQIQVSRKDKAAWPTYYQHIDVLPDQMLDPQTLMPTGSVGRLLSDVPPANRASRTPNALSRGEIRQIDLSDFSAPFGLEENMLVFSRAPIALNSVLAGRSPITTELIDSIDYVDASYYYILPDRK